MSSVSVSKDVALQLDLGHICALDVNNVAVPHDKGEREEYLMQLARDNMQLLANALFSLPVRRTDDGPTVTLPSPLLKLPREKSLPKPKEPTRWEQFAKAKGIQKRKRGAMKWDDDQSEWVARHGGRSKKNRQGAIPEDWVEEV